MNQLGAQDEQVMRATRYQNYSNIVINEESGAHAATHQQLGHQRMESQSFQGGMPKAPAENATSLVKQVKSFDKRPVVNAPSIASESSFIANGTVQQSIEASQLDISEQIDIKNKENLTATQKKTQRKQHLIPNLIGGPPATAG
jgi:hypothetical protein